MITVKAWRKHVAFCVARRTSALHLDEVVLGGGNTKRIGKLPKRCRDGNSAKAFPGGFRLWEKTDAAGSFPIRKS